MSQTYDSTKPETGVTTFGVLYSILRNHFETLRSSFSGTSFPTSPTPVAGQHCYRTDLSLEYEYDGANWNEVASSGAGLGLEIINARGSKSSLDGRLDVAFNEDGTLKASTSLNPSQWYNPAFTLAFVSSSSFTVLTNQTDIYLPDRRLKFTVTAGTKYSDVVSSSYNGGTGLTTVIIRDTVLDSGLSAAEHSIVSPRFGGLDSGALNYKSVGAHKILTEIKTDTYNITTADLGKTLVMNASVSKTFNLPSVNSGEIGGWVDFVKLSGELIIDAADSDTIEDSGAGLTIYCSTVGKASLKLRLVTETIWMIESGIGTWITTN
jgi:hypothetical protein